MNATISQSADTKVLGTITEKHDAEIAASFGLETALAVANAAPGETFLSILIKLGKI